MENSVATLTTEHSPILVEQLRYSRALSTLGGLAQNGIPEKQIPPNAKSTVPVFVDEHPKMSERSAVGLANVVMQAHGLPFVSFFVAFADDDEHLAEQITVELVFEALI